MAEIVIYDVELYKNFFCLCCYNIQRRESKEFIWAKFWDETPTIEELSSEKFKNTFDHDDRVEMFLYLRDKILIGYNNKSFDDPVVLKVGSCSDIGKLYEYAQTRINDTSFGVPKTPYTSIDLMTLIFNQNPRSLKLLGTNLNFPKLQELPIDHRSIIRQDQCRLLVDYCHNDVAVTTAVYEFSKEEITLRAEIGEAFCNNTGIYISDARSIMGDKLLKKLWTDKGGTIPKKWELPSFGDVVLGDIISPKVGFTTEFYRSMLENIKDVVVNKNIEFLKKFLWEDVPYTIAKGGLHACPKDLIIKSNDTYTIYDIDGASYYPFLMLANKVFPPQLGELFLDLFRDVVESRMAYKDGGFKAKATGLKESINAIFGMMGKEGKWLAHLAGMYTITMNGQLYLMMLIEQLSINGIWTCYGNTDGISVLVKDDKFEKYKHICKQWEEYTGITLEEVKYKACYFKDVNNYIIVKADGGIKAKGRYLNPKNHLESLKKALYIPVCATAITKFFVEGIPVMDTLRDVYHNDVEGVYQFCYAAKVSRDFTTHYGLATYKEIKQISKKTGKPLKSKFVLITDAMDLVQNSVRYYVADTGKTLVKKRVGGDKGVMGQLGEFVSGKNTMLFNDFLPADQRPEPDWDYYEQHCYRIITKFKEVIL